MTKTANSLLALAPIPSPTPQHAQSLSPQELQEHRAKIAFDVEVVLSGYWDKRPSDDVKAGILADWSDTLQDWTHEQVLFGLRSWRNDNPNKAPNPSHILALLKKFRGEREMAKLKPAAQAQAPKPRETPSAEAKANADKMVAEAGFALRMGGAA